MNEQLAREILGCSSSANFKEIKASYRRMIVMVHPDKAGQDTVSQERAKEASSRLNHAWEYLENREKQGSLG
jgi:curved DNA-binding protein CbpA